MDNPNANLGSSDSKDTKNLVEVMEKIVIATSSSLDLDTFLQKIIKILVEFSQSDRGAIYLFDQETSDLVMRAAWKYPPELRFNARYETNLINTKKVGLTTFSFLENESLLLNSTDEIISHSAHLGKFVNKKEYGDTDCNSLFCIPLAIADETPIGVLKIENTLDSNFLKSISIKNFEDSKKLTKLISKAIINFNSQEIKINTSINKILSKALISSDTDTSNTDRLIIKLRKIASTFQEVSHAEGVSIWLIEGEKENSKLVCKGAVGKYYDDLEGKSYDLSLDLSKAKKIGLTPYIAKSGETINIKTHEEMISHPMYKGTFNHIIYPDGIDKCKSFIGTPLKAGNRIIGVIKADSRAVNSNHRDNFFITEEVQIFYYLSIITSIIIENEQEFNRIKRHDRQLITLYGLGKECYEFDSYKAIFGHLLTGLTHGDGIGYNRAILFNFKSSKYNSSLIGLGGLGPRDKIEGNLIHSNFDAGNIPIIEDSKKLVREEYASPTPQLDTFIKEQEILLSTQCELYKFIRKTLNEKTPQVQLVSIDKCAGNIRRLFEKLETLSGNFLAFSVLDADEQVFIGICDNVYSNLNRHDEFSVKSANIFVSQISLALSRLSLTKSNEKIAEEAWQEFTAITAHRIGTETSIMSGALDSFIDSIPEHINKEDLFILEKSLENLQKAVREYTELQKPTAIQRKQIQLRHILDSVKRDVEFSLTSNKNHSDQIEIVINCPSQLPVIYGDLDFLDYVFKELFDNSIRAMPNGGKINVYSKISDGYLQIQVSDNGTGINPEKMPYIFNRGVKDRNGGTGLGLYIVKRNIELHGGEVRVDNNTNRGASFYILLPTNKPKLERIMIVEDTDYLLKYLTKSIIKEYLDVKIDVARNEKQAIKLIDTNIIKPKNNTYDYIIVDVNLEDKGGSKIGGIKILEHIVYNNIDVKVIVISAHSGMTYHELSGEKKGVFEKAKELGAFACLSRNTGKSYLKRLNKILCS